MNITIMEILDRTLDKGIVQTNTELDICCPDCIQEFNNNNVNIYVISSVETFLKFSQGVGLTAQSAVPASFSVGQSNAICCTNISASVETSLKFSESFGDVPKNPLPACPTDFNSCISTLKNSLTPEGVDRFLDKGLVEFGSLSGFSQVCKINEFIETSLTLNPSSRTKEESLDRILDKGIIVSCFNDEIVMSSVETWLKYAESNGLTASAAIPA